jgi:hypothetical protein
MFIECSARDAPYKQDLLETLLRTRAKACANEGNLACIKQTTIEIYPYFIGAKGNLVAFSINIEYCL